MIEIEKIRLTKKERKLLKYIENNGISKLDERTQTRAFLALKSYGLLDEILSDKFPATPKDEYGNDTRNAYFAKQEVSRYWIFRRSHLWHEFRDWLALVIAVLGFLLSLYGAFTNIRQDQQFEQYISETEQQSLPSE